MLAALWARLQGWLLMAGAVAAVLVGAYAAGGRAARRSAEIDRQAAREQAARRARHVENETASMGDDAIARELVRDWVRKSSGR